MIHSLLWIIYLNWVKYGGDSVVMVFTLIHDSFSGFPFLLCSVSELTAAAFFLFLFSSLFSYCPGKKNAGLYHTKTAQ